MKKNIFKGKTVLVTGASGSIGSALTLQLIKLGCKSVRAFSNDENGLYELSNLVETIYPNYANKEIFTKLRLTKIRYIYSDIRDINRCIKASENVDIIIHAAALKHVLICELNPEEAVQTNVIGTQNIVKAAILNKVDRFLLISTDKVVNSSTLMGSTKKLCEQLVINSNDILGNLKTKLSVVRFGNVVGSRGSVIPKFINQAKSNRPITVHGKSMNRYVMTISDAIDLTLVAIEKMKGREIFILKSMGIINIFDLANGIKKYFKSKSQIKVIGKIFSEKYSENLVSPEEIKNLSSISERLYVLKSKNKNTSKNNKNFIKKPKPLSSKKIIELLIKENLL